MAISEHIEDFAGYRVVDYDPAAGVAAPASRAAPAAGPRRREFQFIQGASKKFWAIQLAGKAFEVAFGRIGTAGQTQRKEFKTAGEAVRAYDKLIAEKVAKGYVEVGGTAGPAPKPTGKRKAAVAYRVGVSSDEYFRTKPVRFPEKLAAFLAEPGIGSLPALVIGCWSHEGQDSSEVVEALVAARDKLPSLRALFLGDIPYEEQEISWIVQSDITPLFDAYPQLEHFQARGGQGLALGKIKHKNLKSLTIEASNLSAEVVRAVGASSLPALEHLEIWLGTSSYGADTTAADLKGILAGKGLPALRYLGLRNSEIADDIAKALAKAPVLERVRVLDLSLGTLSDKGAQALLAVPALAKLEKLDIHHHYVSPGLVQQLEALGIEVDAGDHRKEDVDEGDEDEEVSYRYVAHSE